MKTRKRLKIVSIILGCVLGILCFIVLKIAASLSSPPRRALQPYHEDWLGHPEQHGIQIERFSCLNGNAPCLLVTPRADVPVSERGAAIRRQLQEMGCTLGTPGKVRGTLVLLHGRTGRKEDLLPVAERFCAVGYRCVLPDLPAHGDSPLQAVYFGTGPGEADFASGVLAEVATKRGFAISPAAIWGISMGGCYAIRSLATHPGAWNCAVIVSSFDSLEEAIREQSWSRAWILAPLLSQAVDFTLKARYGLDVQVVKPAQWIATTKIPIFVAHGTADTLFPLKTGRRLFDAIPYGQKKWMEVDGGTHDNVLVTPAPLYANMAAWFLNHMPKEGD
ncbi:MAG: alpha/beta fold hydrolase [Chthoniobacteraceae bacterium]